MQIDAVNSVNFKGGFDNEIIEGKWSKAHEHQSMRDRIEKYNEKLDKIASSVHPMTYVAGAGMLVAAVAKGREITNLAAKVGLIAAEVAQKVVTETAGKAADVSGKISNKLFKKGFNGDKIRAFNKIDSEKILEKMNKESEGFTNAIKKYVGILCNGKVSEEGSEQISNMITKKAGINNVYGLVSAAAAAVVGTKFSDIGGDAVETFLDNMDTQKAYKETFNAE